MDSVCFGDRKSAEIAQEVLVALIAIVPIPNETPHICNAHVSY